MLKPPYFELLQYHDTRTLPKRNALLLRSSFKKWLQPVLKEVMPVIPKWAGNVKLPNAYNSLYKVNLRLRVMIRPCNQGPLMLLFLLVCMHVRENCGILKGRRSTLYSLTLKKARFPPYRPFGTQRRQPAYLVGRNRARRRWGLRRITLRASQRPHQPIVHDTTLEDS